MFHHFTDHPDAIGETYFQHMRFALGLTCRLCCAGFASFVHALFPFVFEATASDMIRMTIYNLDEREGVYVIADDDIADLEEMAYEASYTETTEIPGPDGGTDAPLSSD